MRKTHYFIYILLLLYSPCAYSTTSNKVQAKSDDASKLFVSQHQDGSGLVGIYYSLMAPAGQYNLQLEVSFNGEDNYQPVPNTFLSGDVSNISPGVNKHLVWDGLQSHPNMLSTSTRIRLVVEP